MDKKEKTRALLDKFYRGETTPEENLLLSGFLSETDGAEEFADDKKLFEALAGAADTSMPPGLEARIKDAIAQSSPRRRIRPAVWLSAGGIAAAVAIMFVLGVKMFDMPDAKISESPRLIAEAKELKTDSSLSNPVDVYISSTEPKIKPENVAPPVKKVRSVNKNISDEEAVLAAEASLRLLGEKMNDAGQKVIEASEQMEQMDNSLKNILQ